MNQEKGENPEFLYGITSRAINCYSRVNKKDYNCYDDVKVID